MNNVGFVGNTQLNRNQWYFITAVYDGSSQKIYLNGALLNSSSVSSSLVADDRPLTIGVETVGSTEYFIGKLDDLRVYNIALSESEIQALYHAGG